MTASSDSDLVLLRRYADRQDAESFLEITNRHAAMVYAVARRVTGNVHDAEDVSQACFLELARRARDVRSCVGGWLHRVAVRRSQNVRRDAAVRKRYEQFQQPPSTALSAEAEWNEIAPLLHDALVGLPDDLRLPLVLLYLQGRSQQDVATELAVSQATISRRAREGIEQLRSTLRRMGVHATAAAMIGGWAAESQATVPTSLRESLGNLALSGIGPAPTQAKVGWNSSSVWYLLVGVSAVVGLSLISWLAAIRTDSIGQLPNASKQLVGRDRNAPAPMIAALTEAVRLAGRNVDYTDVMGDSSLAFVIRWYRLDAPPSVPRDAPWDSNGYLVYMGNKELRLLETSLGLSLQRYFLPADSDAAPLMAPIVTAIEADEYPIGYLANAPPNADEGCCQPRVVLVVGADPEHERLLLRCDDQLRPTWHTVSDLAPRFLIPRPTRAPLARREALIAALKAAVAAWDSSTEQADEVVALCVHRDTEIYSGWRAYDTWIKDLRQNLTGTSERSQHVRSVSQWSFDLLRRGRHQAAMYIRREAQQFSGPQQNRLLRVADFYSRFVEESSDDLFHQATPLVMKPSGTLEGPSNTVDDTVQMLELARQLDRKAIREFRSFLRSIPDPPQRDVTSAVAASKEAATSGM